MMKNIKKSCVPFVLVFCLLANMIPFLAFASDDIKITINGENKVFDVMPKMINDRVLVPMRGIFESLGASVDYIDATEMIIGKRDQTVIKLTPDKNEALINRQVHTLDVAPTLINDRTMVPIRFVSEALGEKVDWDDATNTVKITSDYLNNVAVQDGLARLVSTYHRDVPKEFEKSSDINDLIYFDNDETSYREQLNEIKTGETVFSPDMAFNDFEIKGGEYGKAEIVSVANAPFDKAIRVETKKIPSNNGGFIVTLSEKIKGDILKKDVCLMSFKMRTVSGGDEEGRGRIKLQVQELVTGNYRKSIFAEYTAGSDWEQIYVPFTGQPNTVSIGFRCGYYEQVIEIADITVVNYHETVDYNSLPDSSNDSVRYYKKDMEWRKEALDKIEKIRKGDFKVTVKDKNGNPVKDANVNFNMFEHEFMFGTCVNSSVNSNEEYQKHLEKDFNSIVVEDAMKWAKYDEKPEKSKNQVDNSRKNGIKYTRGHCLIWEKEFGSDKEKPLTPSVMFKEETLKNRELFDKYMEEHIKGVCTEFAGEVVDWDVINESAPYHAFRDVLGNEVLPLWFDTARKYAGDNCNLIYNETSNAYADTDAALPFYEVLDYLKETNADYDGIGLQSHFDGAVTIRSPKYITELFDKLYNTYNKRLRITEFSCSTTDRELQANFMRDFLILAFSHEAVDEFLMWGFYDGSLYADSSPMYNNEWKLKDSGRAMEDLIYNKWWTKDAKAKTDENGNASINGYYGDYDVSVTVNGKTKNIMVSYHKGYDNVLEVVID